jgi:hypothetical protein
MEKVCLVVLIGIFLFGQTSASAHIPENSQEDLTTDNVIITFYIQLSLENLENAVVECGIVDVEDVICFELALAVVELVYQGTLEAFLELSATEEDLEKLTASGIIGIRPDGVNAISELRMTSSDLSNQCMSYYNIEKSGENNCSDLQIKMGEMSCTESATDESQF